MLVFSAPWVDGYRQRAATRRKRRDHDAVASLSPPRTPGLTLRALLSRFTASRFTLPIADSCRMWLGWLRDAVRTWSGRDRDVVGTWLGRGWDGVGTGFFPIFLSFAPCRCLRNYCAQSQLRSPLQLRHPWQSIFLPSRDNRLGNPGNSGNLCSRCPSPYLPPRVRLFRVSALVPRPSFGTMSPPKRRYAHDAQ